MNEILHCIGWTVYCFLRPPVAGKEQLGVQGKFGRKIIMEPQGNIYSKGETIAFALQVNAGNIGRGAIVL